MSTEQFPLKDFQQQAADQLGEAIKDLSGDGFSKKERLIVLDMPTGMGKTVVLSEVIATHLSSYQVLVLTPGAGGLATQTTNVIARRTLGKGVTVKQFVAEDINLSSVPTPSHVFVANWEYLVARDKTTGAYKNRATRDSENTNVFSFFSRGGGGVPVCVIIDEAHHGSSAQAKAIQAFLRDLKASLNYEPLVIEASATPIPREVPLDKSCYRHIKFTVADGRKAQLIRSHVSLNHGIDKKLAGMTREDLEGTRARTLILKAAYERQQALRELYLQCGEVVTPLIGVQIPNGAAGNEMMERVKEFFEVHGITEANGRLAVYLSGDKSEGIKGINDPDSLIEVLIYKQAISTGWDCPRAQIAVGFRSIKSRVFSIQNRGRYFRTYKARHYPETALNTMYLFSEERNFDAGVTADDGALDASWKDSVSLVPDPKRIEQVRRRGLPVGGYSRCNQDGFSRKLVRERLAKFLPIFLDKYEDMGAAAASGRVFLGTGVTSVEDATETGITGTRVSRSVDIGADPLAFNEELVQYITESFVDADGVRHEYRDFIHNSRAAEAVAGYVLAMLRSQPKANKGYEPEKSGWAAYIMPRLMQNRSDDGVELNAGAEALSDWVHAVFTGEGAPDPAGAAAGSKGGQLDQYELKFNGTWHPASNSFVTRAEENKITGERAEYRLYQPLEGGTLFSDSKLSKPEVAFEEHLVELVETGAIKDIWFEHNGTSPGDFALPIGFKRTDGKQRGVIFYPDYYGVITHNDGREEFFVFEVKGKTPEALDGEDLGVTRAKGEGLVKYSEHTGIIGAVVYEKNGRWMTVRRSNSNSVTVDALIAAPGRVPQAQPVQPWQKLAREIPADMEWFTTLGR